MSPVTRTLSPPDVSEVVQGWNRTLPYDTIDDVRFRDVILEDPNHEPEGTLVAVDDGRIVGFMDVITRDSVEGKDGRGSMEGKEHAYLRGLYALPEYPIAEVLTPLLAQTESYLREKGKRSIHVVKYTGRYFFPGLDARYERILRFLDSKGFERASMIDDMDVDLTNWTPNAYQQDAIRRAKAYGAHVVDYAPDMLDALRRFAEQAQIPHWFAPGWEEAYKTMIIAFRDEKIVGWANYSLLEEYGSFGPTAVLPEHRSHGIGTWILVETMLRVQRHGLPRIWAHWTNTPFYELSGWKVCRQYVFLTKQL